MLKTTLLTVLFLTAGHSALAQQPLGAGAQVRQIPPAPTAPKAIPEIRIEGREAPAAATPAGEKILVNALNITGETRFSEAELVAAAGFRPGSQLDLADLRAMASRISAFYNQRGYFVAQAYVPAQDIKDGAVTIAVVEGQYGEIQLRNQSRLSDGLARSVLAGLKPGDIVTAAPLQRRLLLLSDIPGVAVTSTLRPGGAVGTSDLVVDVTPGRFVTGSLEADNGGNHYTGEWRGGGTVALNNLTGHGDVASLRGLTSGSGLNYIRAAYQAQVQNLTLGAAYEYLRYELGEEFEPLDASGTAKIASVFASYPVIRSYDNNLYALGTAEAKTFRDEIGATSGVSDKTARVFTAGVAGDHHDRLWGGGWTVYSAGWSLGDLDIETPAVRAIDAATARTNGGYHKLAFEISRLQNLPGPVSLYGSLRGQVASKNLDPSEKMELGGLYGVRAYPEGEAYADQGFIATIEGRMAAPGWAGRFPGQLQLVGFVDAGSVTINKDPWAPGDNTRSLSAAGVGLTWADQHNLLVKISYAHRLGDEPAFSAHDRSGRVWVQVSKLF
ncbi:ShlB/FhaC/HecB family hemolysin secretion/activation protein [Phenylobacterium sp.]|jgi:hemolysin activation/secretion protein|uniref:ShlB/FhaC/HecB family hemolysin secretion/activation protein n=1 Tax=Phenylobacterium sp. TaxID=1871053 RepID=UPI002F938D59